MNSNDLSWVTTSSFFSTDMKFSSLFVDLCRGLLKILVHSFAFNQRMDLNTENCRNPVDGTFCEQFPRNVSCIVIGANKQDRKQATRIGLSAIVERSCANTDVRTTCVLAFDVC